MTRPAHTSTIVDIVFDGPPGPEPGRFVEVEDGSGASISFGTWVDRGDGMWALRIEMPHQLDQERAERVVRDAVFLALASDGAPELPVQTGYKLADTVAAWAAAELAGPVASDGDAVVRGCPVHDGAVHGGEAEELRAGVETLIDSVTHEPRVVQCADLQRLLDRVNARDSLAHLERQDDDIDTIRWLRQRAEQHAADPANNTERAGMAVALLDRLLALLAPPAIDGIDQGDHAPTAVLRESSDRARPGLIGDETLDIDPTEDAP